MEFVSRSEITVPDVECSALERAFAERAHYVDRHAGFLGLELLRDIRGNGRYVLVTRWRRRAEFVAYMKSGNHARAHSRAHEGLGRGEHDESLVQWLSASEPGPSPWTVACVAALDLARTHSRPVAGVEQ